MEEEAIKIKINKMRTIRVMGDTNRIMTSKIAGNPVGAVEVGAEAEAGEEVVIITMMTTIREDAGAEGIAVAVEAAEAVIKITSMTAMTITITSLSTSLRNPKQSTMIHRSQPTIVKLCACLAIKGNTQKGSNHV